MTNKTNILLDKITRGVSINKNNEVNYLAKIQVNIDKDIPFEYAIVNEGDEDDIIFTQANKYTLIKHQNSNNIYKRSILMLKSSEKTNATVTIDIENLYPREFLVETMGPTGRVILQNDETGSGANADANAGANAGSSSNTTTKWYKDPWILGGIILAIIIIAMILMSKKSPERSLFV